MTAKSILNKLLGVAAVILGVIYFLFPEILLNILGLPYGTLTINLLALVIRMFAIRNIVIGLAMLLSRKGLGEHFWLWLFVVSGFGDAIAALFLQEASPARYLVPLWGSAIALLFFVGLAYGLDIAGIFDRKEVKSTPEISKPEEIKTAEPIPTETKG